MKPTRIIAIGDVHGCSRELHDLLHKLQITDQDTLIFIGDLVNRGPDSRGVLDCVKKLKNAIFILGNHELRLLNFHLTGDKSILKDYDYPTLNVLNYDDWEFFKKMIPTYYVKEYDTVFVHGGFLPNIPWQKQSLDVICHVQVVSPDGKPKKRSKYPHYPLWSDLWQGPPFVVYGHLPIKNEVERGIWSLGIDTACVYGGSLTAYILPSKTLVSVPAYQAYIS
ncbi:MAG: metallophosphoesterase [Verrucomicrobia bacterium]|nr:MAG: metallophosphoesterase [Verrucomicrobiota bacterium]